MDGDRIVGRERELRAAAQALADAARGEARIVVARGPAGIGKSAFLRAVGGEATGLRVARIAGHPAEAEIPYAGFGEVRHALGAEGPPPATADALATATALLDLLAQAAPLLLIVDDVQWLDPASRRALIFAARRLDADAVAIVFGERTENGGLAELDALGVSIDLDPLSDDAATMLLRTVAPTASTLVAQRLVRHAAGIPLTLTEAPRELSPAQLTGAAPLPRELPVGGQLERLFLRRIARLSDRERLALLTFCFDPLPRPTWHAPLGRLGLTIRDADAAERAGLLDLSGEQQSFAHPSIPAAMRGAARSAELSDVHGSLAEQFASDPLRYAIHIRRVDGVPSRQLRSAQLTAAAYAEQQGGFPEAADLWENAARETDPPDRDLLQRAVAAWSRAGAGPAAERLLIELEAAAGDAERARLAASRAFVSMWMRATPPADADALAARGLALLTGPDRSAGRHLLAALATTFVGAARYRDAHDICRRLEAALGEPLSLNEALIADVAAVMIGSDGGGALLRGDWSERYPWDRMTTGMTPIPFAAFALVWLGELTHAEEVVRRHRTAGTAPTAEGIYLRGTVAALVARARGEWDRAAHEFEALERFVIETDSVGPFPFIALHHAHLLASRGDGAGSDALRDEARRRAPVWTPMMDHLDHLIAGHARLIERDYGSAVEHLTISRGIEHQVGLVPSGYLTAFTDAFEAAWHLGDSDRLLSDLDRYERAAEAVGHAEMGALALRCRALEASGSGALTDADALFGEAARILDAENGFEAARTRLLWGQVLRRAKRKAHAIDRLTSAEATFLALGATTLREACGSELAACGRRRASPPDAPDSLLAQLTPREFEVAREVARGASNADAASRLFISERTVEFHLSRVFRKLDVSGRRDLASALGDV